MKQSSYSTRTDVKQSGILAINKPAGLTSRAVVNRVHQITGIRKCGHAGTLDPLATGVLIVCLNRATRLVPYIQQQPKSYEADFRFGLTSSTEDITGDVEAVPNPTFPRSEQLASALPQMTGRVSQIPPQFSAKQVNGKRAYKLARKGESVALPPKLVQIDSLDLLDYQPPAWKLGIRCGSGVYVRSIGRDLGQQFGCGAVMTDLIRTAIGPFLLKNAVDLEELEPVRWSEHCFGLSWGVSHLPTVYCEAIAVRKLMHGQTIFQPLTELGSTAADAKIAVLDDQERLAAIAIRIGEHQLKPEQVFPFD